MLASAILEVKNMNYGQSNVRPDSSTEGLSPASAIARETIVRAKGAANEK
jgi:hypothetical protein